jgi:hypothetical protein
MVHERAFAVFIAALLILIGAARIASTYQVFSQTMDEPAHIAAGLEWLDRGTYTREEQHPPLARVAAAVGPFVEGARSIDSENMWIEGQKILLWNGDYRRSLARARAGILPFFVLASAVVWLWARDLGGYRAATLALVLFTCLPAVLAHAGLATTDMAVTATMAAALYALNRAVSSCALRDGAMLGFCLALAVLAKFSTLLFFPACVFTLIAWRWVTLRASDHASWPLSKALVQTAAIALVVAFVITWGGYRFSGHALNSVAPGISAKALMVASKGLRPLVAAATSKPIVPLTELIEGVRQVIVHNEGGVTSNYMLGKWSSHGSWLFFPLAIAVKTPLVYLLISLIGVVLQFVESYHRRRWAIAAPGICSIAILISVLPSNINIGIRHILPIYPLLSICAGYFLARILRIGRPAMVGPAVTSVVVIGAISVSILAHPDYLSYFNVLGGRHPERIILDSDLDWGQDVYRLDQAMRSRNLENYHAVLYGHGPGVSSLSSEGVSGAIWLPANQEVEGWIAISKYFAATEGYAWLRRYSPVEQVGKSILLYHIVKAHQL